MFESKENTPKQYNSQFIKYLYQEGIRKGIHESDNFYSEIINFVNSPDGQDAFQKFSSLHPGRFGFHTPKHISNIIKAIPL